MSTLDAEAVGVVHRRHGPCTTPIDHCTNRMSGTRLVTVAAMNRARVSYGASSANTNGADGAYTVGRERERHVPEGRDRPSCP
ncbi:hypothetical protein [Hamadaea tsunoensis]|uniref:hypothetical protein n=1 Tax=Hamadaea tsunoensis TaxID=53368 RepID=UPI0012FAE02D|nr:hypothetical protein [Hamadaea tsunoensis]